MPRRLRLGGFGRLFQTSLKLMTGPTARAGRATVARAVKASAQTLKPPPGAGDWLAGVVMGSGGARRYRLYRPPGLARGERLPLLVMLHGCGQDAKSFAMSTRMNRVAAREGFMVLYPEQDRLANLQGCWNWFDTDHGRAHGEAGLILKAIDQVTLLYAADPARVALAGLSAGASMAALMAVRHPERFRAVVMHSGMPPGSAHSTLTALGAMQGRRTVLATGALRAASALHGGPALPPLLVVHGGADTVVSIRNGRAAAEAWADAAGAVAGAPRRAQRGQRHPMEITDFRVGARTVAQLVEVGRLGHNWSGGAAGQPYGDAQGPDASRLAWAFIARQFALKAA
ncbi:MAG: PHB depolymerase family esterase [Rubrivivax sp.]|nr:PHB depolymerase family esterase [Rubrivivax sp.]